MDDVPPVPDSAADDANVDQRGIYNVTLKFAEMFKEILFGVIDANLRNIDRDDFEDLLQEMQKYAWKLSLSKPAYFTNGGARRWARYAAPDRRANQIRDKRRRVVREETWVRELLVGYVDQETLDSILEDECQQAVTHALELLEPRQRKAANAVWLRGLSQRQAAAELGMSRDTVKELLDEAKPKLRLILADWNPRASAARARSAPTRANQPDSRGLPPRAPAPLTPHVEGGTDA